MDATLRELERRVAEGDLGARDALRRARNRAGLGEPLWIADLLEMNGLTNAPMRAFTAGVRAVLGTTECSDLKVYPDTRHKAVEILVDTQRAPGVMTLFGLDESSIIMDGPDDKLIKFPFLARAADERIPLSGATLSVEHQDAFVEAAARSGARPNKKRPPRIPDGFLLELIQRVNRNEITIDEMKRLRAEKRRELEDRQAARVEKPREQRS